MIVWFPGRIPKAAFCLWLAVRERLYTQDRWFNFDPSIRCYLCNTQMKDHNHLFFNCPISNQIWRLVQSKCGIHVLQRSWTNTIEWLSMEWKIDNLTYQSWKLSLAVTVYNIWLERNSRLHCQKANGEIQITEKIYEMIIMKLSSLKGLPESTNNRRVATTWNLPVSIFDK